MRVKLTELDGDIQLTVLIAMKNHLEMEIFKTPGRYSKTKHNHSHDTSPKEV